MRLRTARAIGVLAAATAPLTALPAPAATPVWVPTLAVDDQGRVALSALSDGTVFFSLSRSARDRLLRSTDAGRTWAPLPAPPEPDSAYTRFATPTTGWSLGAETVYATRTAGTSWSRTAPLPSDGGPPRPLTLGVGEGTSTVVAGGYATRRIRIGCNHPSNGVLWTSHDAGRRWTRTNLGRNVAPLHVSVYDAKRAVAIGYEVSYEQVTNCLPLIVGTAIWLTADGGRTWRRTTPCRTSCTAAVIVAPGRVLVGRNDGSTSRSEDGGRTWREGDRLTPVDTSPNSGADQSFWVNAFAFADPRVGYASTKGGGTWRTADGGRTWQREASAELLYGGFGYADVAVVDAERAVAGGLNAVHTRLRTP